MTDIEYIDKIKEAEEILDEAMFICSRLSLNFRNIGMDKPADMMEQAFDDIKLSNKLYQEAFSELLNQMVSSTQQANDNMMQAIFNTIKVAK